MSVHELNYLKLNYLGLCLRCPILFENNRFPIAYIRRYNYSGRMLLFPNMFVYIPTKQIKTHRVRWCRLKYHNVGTITISNIKIVEKGKLDTSNTQIHDGSLSWLEWYIEGLSFYAYGVIIASLYKYSRGSCFSFCSFLCSAVYIIVCLLSCGHVLSIFQCTASDYRFGIFKLFPYCWGKLIFVRRRSKLLLFYICQAHFCCPVGHSCICHICF